MSIEEKSNKIQLTYTCASYDISCEESEIRYFGDFLALKSLKNNTCILLNDKFTTIGIIKLNKHKSLNDNKSVKLINKYIRNYLYNDKFFNFPFNNLSL